MNTEVEVFFLNLPGPAFTTTHPDTMQKSRIFYPKSAAKKVIKTARQLLDLGLKVALLPPQKRPHIESMLQLGFRGDPYAASKKTFENLKDIFFALSAAGDRFLSDNIHFAAASDTENGRINLLHTCSSAEEYRLIEHHASKEMWQKALPNHLYVTQSSYLTTLPSLATQGSLYLKRLCRRLEEPGIYLLTQQSENQNARHVLFRQLRFLPERLLSSTLKTEYPGYVCYKNLLFIHENTFKDTQSTIDALQKRLADICNTDLLVITVKESEIPFEMAKKAALFEIVPATLPDGGQTLFVSENTLKNGLIQSYLGALIKNRENPIREMHALDLHDPLETHIGLQRMILPLSFSRHAFRSINPSILFGDPLEEKLSDIIQSSYPDTLSLDMLCNSAFLKEADEVLEKLKPLL